MTIEIFCPNCKNFTRMDIMGSIEMEPGLEEHHMKCEKCGYTWWEVDDYREELEEETK